MYIFSIEGNISVGKSTFVKRLKNMLTTIYKLPVIYLEEPVNEWESIKSKDGTNMIQLFYSDTKRYAFAFQMMAYISRLKNVQDAIKKNPNSIIITERCLLSDYRVFATMLYENEQLLDEEFSIYKKWFSHFSFPITGIIYLQCTPELAYERCLSRNRIGETISLEYLKKCHNKHEEWLENEPIPILSISTDSYSAIDNVREFIHEEIHMLQPIQAICLTQLAVVTYFMIILWVYLLIK